MYIWRPCHLELFIFVILNCLYGLSLNLKYPGSSQLTHRHSDGQAQVISFQIAQALRAWAIKRLLGERIHVIGIFVDFKKAFDIVDHENKLRKLYCYGIRGHSNMFFRSYLIDRRQFTVANGVQLDIGFVKCGVPQGSALGLLFFLSYRNDIFRAVGCNAVGLFPDYTSLLSSGLNLNNVMIQAKELFHKLHTGV